jgi:serine/threonine protein kinase
LLQRIGGGSYGEVWLARNALGAYRAIKVIHRKSFEDDRPFEREFSGIQKFEPISRSHEGLVDILQVGRQSDSFYYVMELADDAGGESKPVRKWERGTEAASPAHFPTCSPAHLRPDTYAPRTLRQDLKQRSRLPVNECVEIALALTSGLAHLHKHGLVHRDIKPSNIIFVSGAPKLADIGLVTDADTTLSYVGTEGYIPPEGPGAAQADIFSLGKVLYEISTGQDRRQFLQRASGVSPEDPFAGEAPGGPAGRMHGSTLKSCRKSSLGASSVLVGKDSGVWPPEPRTGCFSAWPVPVLGYGG